MKAGPVAVVVAMEAELRHLRARLDVERTVQAGPWRDELTSVGDLPVVLVRSGMGMINAAAATEGVIDRHAPRAVLNFGCTGAHRRDVLPGDVVVGTRTVHHSKLNILPSGEELYVARGGEVGGESWHPTELDADPTLLAAARTAAEDWAPEPWPAARGASAIPVRSQSVHFGPVASADIWTQAAARLDLLHQRHGTLCEDMEAAAIAQVCALHGVPFLAIKDLSNNEFLVQSDLVGGFSDFPIEEVGKRAAALTHRLFERLATRS